MRHVRLGLCAALIATAGCAEPPTSDGPADAVRGLYRTLSGERVRGAPSPKQLEVLAPYLSTDLLQLLSAARELHDRERAQRPGEKPPFNDGDLFSSLFEGPTSFEVAAGSQRHGEHRLPVRCTYESPTGTIRWTDEVVVRREGGRWVVADIEYGGEWDFANRGSLAAQLRRTVLATVPEHER